MPLFPLQGLIHVLSLIPAPRFLLAGHTALARCLLHRGADDGRGQTAREPGSAPTRLSGDLPSGAASSARPQQRPRKTQSKSKLDLSVPRHGPPNPRKA